MTVGKAGISFNTDDVEPLAVPGCSAADLGCEGGGPSVDLIW